MPSHSPDDLETKRAPKPQNSDRSRFRLRKPLANIPDVATAALVGSLVAIVISPISQSLSFYLSQFLSRPVLSIEFVEVIPVDQVIKIDSLKLRSLRQSPGYNTFIGQQPSLRPMQLISPDGTLSVAQAKDIARSLSLLKTALEEQLARIQAVERDLVHESNLKAIRSIIQHYSGPMFGFLAFAADPPEQMKASFLEHLRGEGGAASDLLNITESILRSIGDAAPPVANVRFKMSILNRGDTDGLIRNVGTLGLMDSDLSVEILKVPSPKSPHSTADMVAVPVAVTNPHEEIREQSVGKVEKHSMIEVWFAINEKKLSAAQSNILTKALPHLPSSRFRITLTDQEKVEIRYTSPSPHRD